MHLNRVKNKKISLDDLRANFIEIEPALTQKEAMDEANRCLYCYDAPCIKACPTDINIPSFIKKIASGNLKGSAKVIMEANPVGASCARVCPTEELCEGACVLNDASLPIMIGNLQRHATNWAIHNNQQLFKAGEAVGKTVAIIGGGPAGLSAARELARLGYEVTIFEAKEKAGGLDTYGIVSFRLPQEVSLWEVEQIEKLGVKILTNTKVGRDIQAEEIIDNYDAVILAVGMSKVPMLGIEGEDAEGVLDAIDFVETTKTPPLDPQYIGKKIVIIGAGNTAIDAATCSVRLGAGDVKMVYRRTEAEMTAYEFEYEFAKQDGVEFRWLTQPTKIVKDESGKVKALECVRMELGEPDDSGRRRPVPVQGSEFSIEVDAVIKAIGQTRYVSLIEEFGLDHNRGIVKINTETHQTSNPKVYAAGDVIFGDGQGDAMVVTAAQQGKLTAHAIHKTLMVDTVAVENV
ncbi:glutamate synthase (NADPH/NADH) small chain [Mesobacillus persicus]|uniref:Glutamate synthase (NADPH/NADH) small chain n=1 Tax=Mesobacillus persicus TaxID=930146 RepID=A0A1H8AI42_9BACI|nr:NAD(P)-dependent oxidoreductase [Mesobacillus persicus]SEM70291.1 glutamate synthase (NADPH/NADH) small chain [Mesobacillus persicus]